MDILFTMLIPLVAVAVIVIVAIRIASHTFKCKHCSGEFKIKWSRVLTTMHSDHEYMLECPHCKTKDWCSMLPRDN